MTALWVVLLGLFAGVVLTEMAEASARWMVYGSAVLAVALLGPQVVRLAGSAERVLLWALVVSLQLEVAYTPVFWRFTKVAGPWGLHVTPLLLVSLALAVLATRRNGLRWMGQDRRLLAAGALVCATGVASFVKSGDHSLSVFGLFELLTLWLVALVAAHYAGRRNGLVTIVNAIPVAMVLQGLVILGEWATGSQLNLATGVSQHTEHLDLGRLSGTFSVPGAAGTFLAVCSVFVFGRFCLARQGEATRHAVVLGIGMLGLLLTQARAAWVGAALGMGGLAAHLLMNHRLLFRRAVLLAVFAVFALALAWPQIAGRFERDHGSDWSIRWNLIVIAARMIQGDPILGVGLNTASNVVGSYGAEVATGMWTYIVHNQFLLIACETGIPGLLAFLWLVWLGLRGAAGALQAHDATVRELGRVLLWCGVTMVWALNLDHVSGALSYALVWFIVGTSRGVAQLSAMDAEVAQTAVGPRGARHLSSVPAPAVRFPGGRESVA